MDIIIWARRCWLERGKVKYAKSGPGIDKIFDNVPKYGGNKAVVRIEFTEYVGDAVRNLLGT